MSYDFDASDFLASQRKAPDEFKQSVVFYMRDVYLQGESEKQGRPIYVQKPYVQIRFPGDNKTVIDEAVKDHHKHDYPRHWKAFEDGGKAAEAGTPIRQWAMISKSQAEELERAYIYTVEQLAELPDQFVTRFLGGHLLKEQAKTFLKTASDSAFVTTLTAENQHMKDEIAALKMQIEELKTVANGMTAAPAQNNEIEEIKRMMAEMVATQAPAKRGRKASDEE